MSFVLQGRFHPCYTTKTLGTKSVMEFSNDPLCERANTNCAYPQRCWSTPLLLFLLYVNDQQTLCHRYSFNLTPTYRMLKFPNVSLQRCQLLLCSATSIRKFFLMFQMYENIYQVGIICIFLNINNLKTDLNNCSKDLSAANLYNIIKIII